MISQYFKTSSDSLSSARFVPRIANFLADDGRKRSQAVVGVSERFGSEDHSSNCVPVFGCRCAIALLCLREHP